MGWAVSSGVMGGVADGRFDLEGVVGGGGVRRTPNFTPRGHEKMKTLVQEFIGGAAVANPKVSIGRCRRFSNRSPDYRYVLTRSLRISSKPGLSRTVLFCMLNPSTADQTENDPTHPPRHQFRSTRGLRLSLCNQPLRSAFRPTQNTLPHSVIPSDPTMTAVYTLRPSEQTLS